MSKIDRIISGNVDYIIGKESKRAKKAGKGLSGLFKKRGKAKPVKRQKGKRKIVVNGQEIRLFKVPIKGNGKVIGYRNQYKRKGRDGKWHDMPSGGIVINKR